MKNIWNNLKKQPPYLYVILVLVSYLSLANLDYSYYWHDEGNTVAIAKNILSQGDIIGWDQRNLVGGVDAKALNDDLRESLSPMMYLLTAAGIGIFGDTLFGGRFFHALLGLFSVIIFYYILKDLIYKNPRLILITITVVGLFAQLLLYFRNARYFSLMLFAFILMFFCYQRYWQHKKMKYYYVMIFAGILGVFSQYANGVIGILTIACFHLIFHFRETKLKDYLLFALASIIPIVLMFIYLFWLGVFEREGGLLNFSGRDDVTLLVSPIHSILRIYAYVSTSFKNDWITYPIFLWFVYYAIRTNTLSKKKNKSLDESLLATIKIFSVGFLYVVFAGIISSQPSQLLAFSDTRYFFVAIPFLLIIKAYIIDRLWQKNIIAGIVLALIIINSNIFTYPIHLVHLVNKQPTFGFHLYDYISEIHRDYQDSNKVASQMLAKHAKQDDTVYTADFFDRDALVATVGDKFIFCCHLNTKTKRLEKLAEQLNDPNLTMSRFDADWIVLFEPYNEAEGGMFPYLSRGFKLVDASNYLHYPTNRPALNYHLFYESQNHRYNEIVLLENQNKKAK